MHAPISHHFERSVKHRGLRSIPVHNAYLRPCEACGDRTLDGKLCRDCVTHAHAHREGDPYDDLGGEGGGAA